MQKTNQFHEPQKISGAYGWKQWVPYLGWISEIQLLGSPIISIQIHL